MMMRHRHCQLLQSSIRSVNHHHHRRHCRELSILIRSYASSNNIIQKHLHCKTILSKQQQCRSITTQQASPSPPIQHPHQRLTISRATHLLNSHKLTPQQLCQHAHNLATFGEHSLHLNAYIKLLPWNNVLQQAQLSQDRITNGQRKSWLDGIPVTVKANVAVGRWWMMPSSSSAILMDERDNNDINGTASDFNNNNDIEDEEVYESDIAKKLLKECGAVLIGITNMDEFGMGSLGLNSGISLQDSGNHCNNVTGSSTDDSKQAQQYFDKKQYANPIYNPLPWMHRLSMLQSHNQHYNDNDDPDQYWIEQIQNSTMQNPHGISDEDALEELLNEVRYWTQPPHNDGDSSTNIEASSRDYTATTTSPLLSSGGSSSGAAVTIAHGSSLLSIGTDTGGSLRLPAAWTSTVGFKPTYGTFSRYGVVSYASSLDTVGFVTGSVECARIGWECLSGSDRRSKSNDDDYERSCVDFNKSRDATARVYHDDGCYGLLTSQQHQQQEPTTDTVKPLANIRIGIPNAFSLHETPPLIANAWSAAANTLQNIGGATLVPIPESVVSSEWIKLSCAAYYVLACAEASSNLSRYDGVRFGLDVDLNDFANLDNVQGYEEYHPLSNMTALEEKISTTRVLGFGDEVQRRVLAGTSVLSSDRFHTHYEAAAVVRAKVSQSIERAFRSTAINNGGVDDDKVDVMLVPTALSFPCTLNPHLGDRMMDDMDPTAAFGNDVMTIPISLGGFPSISVPAQDDNDNSDRREKDVVGLQVFGMRGSEDIVLQVANAINNSS
mmetsp:Transcript_31834/g.54293  ORF Transcript_31834/g.54293 Transcript_31834/m.54293 type:complete len:780 (+) Transcript_31834:26-2365(+)